jgi:transposase
MKFKQSAQQNQRIERITHQHLIIGIDIAKFTHVARAVDYRGIERGSTLSFSNSVEGFESLALWVQTLSAQFNKTEVLFGVEPTGHYWFNLAHWLRNQAFELVLVNPFHVKRNKENRDNSPTKNDAKDALVIADMVKNGYYRPATISADVYQALRHLVTTRELIARELSSVVNHLYRWTDLYFPEFQHVFKTITSKTALATLTAFGHPEQVRVLSVDDVIAGWKIQMKRAGNRRTAIALIEAAKHTVGCSGHPEQAKFNLSLYLQQMELYHKQLAQIHQQMSILLEQIPTVHTLIQIKGMSELTLATLYAEAGDLSEFTHGQQLLRLAGLHLCESSSGTRKSEVRISKRGRPRLRKLLYRTVFQMVSVNPEFKELHRINKQEKHHSGMKSILKLCGKLARMLVAMAKQHTEYDSNKLQPIAA